MSKTEESLRIARLLESVVLLRKLPLKELEAKLEVSSGYLFRIFTGRIELRYRHITDILDAIGFDLASFFALAYKLEGGGNPKSALISEALRQPVNDVKLPDATPLPPLTSEGFEMRVIEILSKMGVLDEDDSAKPRRTRSTARGKKKPRS